MADVNSFCYRIKEYFIRQILKRNFLSGQVLHDSLLQLLLEHGVAVVVVAMRLRCSGIFKYDLLQIHH